MPTKKIVPRIWIPSRNRSDTGTTWTLFPGATVFVHEREEKTYRAALPEARIETHHCDHINEIREEIMYRTPFGEWNIQLDDDIVKVGYFGYHVGKGRGVDVAETGDKHLAKWLEVIALADKHEVHLVGESPTKNPLNYRPEHRLSRKGFVEGHFLAIKNTGEFHFDPRFKLKGDYDMSLQHLASARGILRANFLWSDYTYRTARGGCRDYRKEETERECALLLIEKWPQWVDLAPRPESPWEVKLR